LEALDSSTTVDVVLCNPPFHQQNTVTDHIALQMFSDAKRHLSRGGELRIIGNRHLDYPLKLKGLFGGYKVIASNAKFSILSCIK
jgi:16S rRNA (guanine1207-N2)-methyltransferase/23S rRNA (guanine1835-N2)-methyltransferase